MRCSYISQKKHLSPEFVDIATKRFFLGIFRYLKNHFAKLAYEHAATFLKYDKEYMLKKSCYFSNR